MENKIDIVSPDSIKPYIYEVRGRNVMIDSDLATLYGIETKNLKRAVRMNIARFPADFMFELTKEEYDFLRCNFFTLKNGRGKHSKYLPYAFYTGRHCHAIRFTENPHCNPSKHQYYAKVNPFPTDN